jgi:hypothetical protein
MNDIFNLHRFGLVFKKTLFEHPLQTFGVLGIAIVTTLLLYHPYKCDSNSILVSDDTSIIMMILFLSGSSLVFFLFSQFSDNAKGYNYLLLPSSYFEKWLSGFIITCVLFLGIYLVFFRLFDSYCVKTFHNALLANAKTNSPQVVQTYLREVQIKQYDSPDFKNIFSMFFIITGATAVGSLYFNKNAFMKIFLTLIGLIWAYIFLNSFIPEFFFKGIHIKTNPYLFGSVIIEKGGAFTLQNEYKSSIEILFYYCLPITFWLIALIRFREKEI